MADFGTEYLPVWCGRCNKQGIYLAGDYTNPCLVIHHTCGYEFLGVWCPKCGAGFSLPIEPGTRPASWKCPECRAEYALPDEAFACPKALLVGDEMPDAARQNIPTVIVIGQYAIGALAVLLVIILAIILLG